MQFSVDVSFDDNFRKTAKDVDIVAANGLNEMANDTMRLAQPKTPMKSGRLRRNRGKRNISDHAVAVYWRQSYAVVQEAGKRGSVRFRHYTTPGTGPHYAENAVSEVKKNAVRYFSGR